MDHRIFQLSQLRATLCRDQGASPRQALRQLCLRGVREQGPRLVGPVRLFRLESRSGEFAGLREKVGSDRPGLTDGVVSWSNRAGRNDARDLSVDALRDTRAI